MKPHLLAALLVAPVLLPSCSKHSADDEARPTTTVPAAPVPPPEAPLQPSAQPDDSGLVTPDDLADRAAAEITQDNLEQQLDSLEKEIGSAH